MADARIEEFKTLLPQCLLPDWVRLGRRLGRLLRDAHHPAQRDALLERLRQQVLASIALREERRRNVPRTAYPPELPITARKDDIVGAIRAHQVVVIAGETGSDRGQTRGFPLPGWGQVIADDPLHLNSEFWAGWRPGRRRRLHGPHGRCFRGRFRW